MQPSSEALPVLHVKGRSFKGEHNQTASSATLELLLPASFLGGKGTNSHVSRSAASVPAAGSGGRSLTPTVFSPKEARGVWGMVQGVAK